MAALLGGAAAGDDSIAAESCSFAAPLVLPEPSHTRGTSNTIRWEHVPKSCWIGEDNSGKASTERRFTVRITNVATALTASVTVHGEDEVDATIDPGELPVGAGGQIEGTTFEYVVVRKEKWCSAGSPTFGTCQATATRTSHPPSPPVRSTQDGRAPSGSLVLAGGATFVRTLDVPAGVSASDPGPSASGPGYVAFGGAGRRGGCAVLAGCAEPLASGLTVRVAGGADGPRTVEARVYDRARGPADDAGATTIGTPPGNVSAPFQDTVVLDRTPPYIFMRISTVRVTVGAPVTFDASQSTDPNGSGVQPTSGEWTFGDGGRATGLVAAHTYPRAGRFALGFSVADQAGNVALATPAEIEVVAAPVAPQPKTSETPPAAPPPATVDRVPPTLTALGLRRSGARVTVGFRLSERAVVRIEVRRLQPRPVRRMTSISRALGAGRRGIVLPPSATEKAGRYAIVLVARDRAGNVSKPRTLRLTRR